MVHNFLCEIWAYKKLWEELFAYFSFTVVLV
jgi:hypothetical protein